MEYKITSLFLLLFLLFHLINTEMTKCGDTHCKVIISKGRTTQIYPRTDGGRISCKIDEVVNVYGKEKEMWIVEINNKKGLLPARFIKEEKLFIKDEKLVEAAILPQSKPENLHVNGNEEQAPKYGDVSLIGDDRDYENLMVGQDRYNPQTTPRDANEFTKSEKSINSQIVNTEDNVLKNLDRINVNEKSVQNLDKMYNSIQDDSNVFTYDYSSQKNIYSIQLQQTKDHISSQNSVKPSKDTLTDLSQHHIEQIDSNNITQQQVEAKNIYQQQVDTNDIQQQADANNIHQQQLDANNIQQQANANNIHQQQLNANNIQQQPVDTNNIQQQANANNIHQQQLDDNNIHQQQLDANNIHQQQLDANNIQQQQVYANYINRQQVDAKNINQQSVDTNNIQQQVDANNIHQQQLDGNNIQQQANTNNIQQQANANNIHQQQLDANNIHQQQLDTNNIQQQQVYANNINRQQVDAKNINQQPVDTNNIQQQANANNIHQQQFDANNIQQQQFDAYNIQQQQFDAYDLQQQQTDANNIPQQNNANNIPQQNTANNIPQQKYANNIPQQNNANSIPELQINANNIPQQKFDANNVPQQQSNANNIPQQKYDANNVPQQQSNANKIPQQNIPQLQIDANNISQQQNDTNKIPQNENDNNIPQHENDVKTISQHENDAKTNSQHESDVNTNSQHESDVNTISQHENDAKIVPQLENDAKTISQHENGAKTISLHENGAKTISQHENGAKTISQHENDAKTISHVNDANNISQHENDINNISQHENDASKIPQEQINPNNIQQQNNHPNLVVNQKENNNYVNPEVTQQNDATKPKQHNVNSQHSYINPEQHDQNLNVDHKIFGDNLHNISNLDISSLGNSSHTSEIKLSNQDSKVYETKQNSVVTEKTSDFASLKPHSIIENLTSVNDTNDKFEILRNRKSDAVIKPFINNTDITVPVDKINDTILDFIEEEATKLPIDDDKSIPLVDVKVKNEILPSNLESSPAAEFDMLQSMMSTPFDKHFNDKNNLKGEVKEPIFKDTQKNLKEVSNSNPSKFEEQKESVLEMKKDSIPEDLVTKIEMTPDDKQSIFQSTTEFVLNGLQPILGEDFSYIFESELIHSKMSKGSAALLLIMSCTIVLLYLIHFCMTKLSKEAPLLKEMNDIKREIRFTIDENMNLKTKLSHSNEQVENAAKNSIQSLAAIDLQRELLQTKENCSVIIQSYEGKVQQVEQELEESTANGLEMHKMLDELLQSQKDSTNFQASVDSLQNKLDTQKEMVEVLTTDLAMKTHLNEELRMELKNKKDKISKLDSQIEQLGSSLQEAKALKYDASKDLQEKGLRIKELENASSAIRNEVECAKVKIDHQTKHGELLQSNLSGMKNELAMKSAEILVSKECCKKLQKSNHKNINLSELFDIINLKANLKVAENRNKTIVQEMEVLLKENETISKNLKEIETHIQQYNADKINACFERDEAVSKLNVLTDYFKEKESVLTKELESQEHLRMDAEGSIVGSEKRIQNYETEVDSYRSKIDTLKEKMDEQMQCFKVQLTEEENKSHENWLKARSSERFVIELRKENSQLRQRLTMFGRDDQPILIKPLPNRMDANGSASSPASADGDLDLDGMLPPPMQLPFGPMPFPPGPPMLPPHPSMMGPLPPLQLPDRRMPPAGRIASPPSFHRGMSPPRYASGSYSPNSDYSNYSDRCYSPPSFNNSRGRYSPSRRRRSPDRNMQRGEHLHNHVSPPNSRMPRKLSNDMYYDKNFSPHRYHEDDNQKSTVQNDR